MDFGIVSPALLAGGDTLFKVPAVAGSLAPAVTGSGEALGSTATDAIFDVGGEGTNVYNIGVTSGTIQLTHATAPNMTVVLDQITHGAVTFNGTSTTGTLSGGTDVVFVGGTLTVPELAAGGPYAGSFTITVSYP